jgi:ABC-type uncharacterized transport system auxiliary subunit
MVKTITFVLLTIGLLTLACGSSPRTRYYTLHYPEPETSESSSGVIRVEPFTADAIHRDDRFVYHTSPYELGFDAYRRWATSPDDLLTENLVIFLRAGNHFEQVLHHQRPTVPYWSVEGDVERFEERLIDGIRQVHVSLWIRIRDRETENVLWSGRIDTQRPIDGNTGEDIVAAMSDATHAVFQDIQDRLLNCRGITTSR